MTLALLSSFAAQSTANNTILTIPITSTIPVGSKLILGLNKSTTAGTTNGPSSIVDTKGNVWTKNAHSCRATTHDMSIYSSAVTSQLISGDAVTVNFTAISTRKAGILSAWSAVTGVNAASSNGAFGDGGISVGSQGSSATESSSTTANGTGLVVIAFSRAGGTAVNPASPGSITEIATVTTAAGSSDRGLTLAYYTTAALTTQTASGTLAASQGWAAAVASFDAVLGSPPPVLPGDVIIGGAKKAVVGSSVIIGGVKKTVVSSSVIVGGIKRPLS